MQSFSFKVIGITFVFKDFPHLKYSDIKAGDVVNLAPDPSNKYDKNALAVYINGDRYGYAPNHRLSESQIAEGKKSDRDKILDAMLNDEDVHACVSEVKTKTMGANEYGRAISESDGVAIVGINISVEIGHKDDNPTSGIYKTVIGTDKKILFDEGPHKYYYKGVQFCSVTTYIEKYLGEFRKYMMSKNCSKSWNFPAAEIREAWDMSRDIAGIFGTAIHGALEYDVKYQGCDNLFIKHPAIRLITDDFWRFYKKLGFNIKNIQPEVMIADFDRMLCGQADILYFNKETGKYRIQDYKVNHGSTEERKGAVLAPFDHLPQNKISKNQIQLSLYANMAENLGFEIEGLDIFVYDGILDKKTNSMWKHYEVDILDVLNADKKNTSS